MGIIFSLCCKKKAAEPNYKKVDAQPHSADIEAGGADDEDEDWDEFPEADSACGARPGGASTAASARVPEPEPEEPEPEPEPDPFAEMGMAPTITKTKRHVAQSVWAQPAAPSCSRFAMDAEEPAGDGGWGGADEDLGDALGINERQRAAQQRREQRRRQLEAKSETKTTARGLAATKVVSE